jgi:hypothetical protein
MPTGDFVESGVDGVFDAAAGVFGAGGSLALPVVGAGLDGFGAHGD